MYKEKENQVENLSKLNKEQTTDIRKLIIESGNTMSNNVRNNSETLELRNFGIVVSDASAKWTDAQTENSLENINLTVRPGQLVAIIGPVGAGKVHTLQPNNINNFFNSRV